MAVPFSYPDFTIPRERGVGSFSAGASAASPAFIITTEQHNHWKRNIFGCSDIKDTERQEKMYTTKGIQQPYFCAQEWSKTLTPYVYVVEGLCCYSRCVRNPIVASGTFVVMPTNDIHDGSFGLGLQAALVE